MWGEDVRVPTQEPPESAYPGDRLGGPDGEERREGLRALQDRPGKYAEDDYYPEDKATSAAYPHDDEGGESNWYL